MEEAYPLGKPYNELLNWHVRIWGTRADLDPEIKNDPWSIYSFIKKIFCIQDIVDGVGWDLFGRKRDIEHSQRLVDIWMQSGKAPPSWDKVADNILDALFGQYPKHIEWREHLIQARRKYYEEQKKTVHAKRAARRGRRPIGQGGRSISLEPAQSLTLSLPPDAANQYRAPYMAGELVQDLGLRRNLLEVLALRFEHENPDAPDIELIQFLKSRAVEYRSLQARLSALTASEKRMSNSLASAGAELEAGNFGRAESILREAEELQQSDHTLKAVRIQADIRAARGDAALLSGKYKDAYNHYLAAALFFKPFDRTEEAERRTAFAERLYGSQVTEARYLAAELLNDNLVIYEVGSLAWSDAQLFRGIILTRYVDFTGLNNDEKTQAFSTGMSALEAALETLRNEVGETQIAVVEAALADALATKGAEIGKSEAADFFEKAVKLYISALNRSPAEADLRRWIENKGKLSSCLSLFAIGRNEAASRELYTEAAMHAREALARPKECFPTRQIWLGMQHRLLSILETLERDASPIDATHMLSEAVGLVTRLKSELDFPELKWDDRLKELKMKLARAKRKLSSGRLITRSA